MERVDPVILKIRADQHQMMNELRKSTSFVQSQLNAQDRAIVDLETQMKNSSGKIGASFKSLAATLGAAFTGRELIALTDSFTEFQNRLKVAGVAASELKSVQDALFGSAQRYGVELNVLGALFSRTAQAASELGVSQNELLSFTDNVAAALKVQGGSVESASGAILQLGQALQSGTVRAEEFNSILEGAFPIAKAAANGSDRFGGSVAKLRQAMLDGNVTSRQFFEYFQKGAGILRDQAEDAALTTSQAFTKLRNALEVYFGEADKANGASAALGEAIGAIADNLDTLIPAIAVVSTALGVGFVTNAVRAQVAAQGATGSLVAMRAAALGAFGGPVGLAITAVTVAIGTFAVASTEAAASAREFEAAIDASEDALEKAQLQADAAKDGVAGLGRDSDTSTPKVQKFAGAVGDAADQLFRLAQGRRAAAIADVQADRLASQKRQEKAANQPNRILGVTIAPGSQASAYARVLGRLLGKSPSRDPEAAKVVVRERQTQALLDRQMNELIEAPLPEFVRPEDRATAAPSNTKGGNGSAAKDAAEKVYSLKEVLLGQNETLDDAQQRWAKLQDTWRTTMDPKLTVKPLGDIAMALQGATMSSEDLEEALRNATDEELAERIRFISGAMQNDFARTLADVAVYGDNLGDSLENAFKRAAAAMLEAYLQAKLIEPLFDSFRQGSGASGGNVLGGIANAIGGIFGGGKATGGPVQGGTTYLVGEKGPELFRPGSSGSIIPNHQLAQAGASGGGVSTLRVELSGDLRGEMRDTAAGIAVEVVRSAAPALVSASAASTQRSLTRPSLPGGVRGGSG